MSLDTYIYIQKMRGREGYKIWDCVASCVCPHKKHHLVCQKVGLIGEEDNLDKAMKRAKRLISEYGVFTSLWCK